MKINKPSDLLSYKKITSASYECNAYARTFEEELSRFKKEDLIIVYRDMLYVRRFEEILLEAKENGREGYHFNYASHLSIGQEAVAVGEAFALKVEDIVFGTHRSHGETIAKALRAIELLEEKELLDILESYPTPTYKAIKNTPYANLKEKAKAFLFYGAFSEIFARTTGLQRGLGGSMHLHFTPFGVYPNNAIVGGSAPLAVGASLFNRINGKAGLVVANLGDGALGCGAVYEAMQLANMSQFKGLWKENKGLPLLFLVSDNLYARGGNTREETGATLTPASLSLAFKDMAGESVDGTNPLAVIDAVARHRERILSGEGVSLISATTYRHKEHSIGDNKGREDEEVSLWKELDPVKTYPEKMIKSGVCTLEELRAIREEVESTLSTAYTLAIDNAVSPEIDLEKDEKVLSRHLFNNEHSAPKKGKISLENNAEYLRLREEKDLTIRDAVALGIMEGFINDDTFVAYGEDVRGWNSKNSPFYGLERDIPMERLFNTSISESAIVGAEVGYAMRGGRVVSELLYADFLTRASDEIINQTAKWQSLSGGTLKLPLTLRLPVGRSYGGQHSQDLSGLIARVPGLKVYYPSTPTDTLKVMRECLSSMDPSIIFEPKEYYSKKEEFPSTSTVLERTSKKLEGTDATIVTIGSIIYEVKEALQEGNKSIDLFSLVSLSPIDYAPILSSVKKTGRLFVIGESTLSGGLMTDVAYTIQKECFTYLHSPVEVIALENSIIPPNGARSGVYNLKEKLIEKLKF